MPMLLTGRFVAIFTKYTRTGVARTLQFHFGEGCLWRPSRCRAELGLGPAPLLHSQTTRRKGQLLKISRTLTPIRISRW